ncbi:hypothetical protein H4R20_002072 [Coemansia guatemalensis]|uniref:Uncharacterized protein n=1 Tax=Coemansia guatemalensis TaxID=2761395 RepID=A0A9W8HXX3_9FUNG|nr:hypothetical protein H4R20_002072 [Coemansia guatemalensis]
MDSAADRVDKNKSPNEELDLPAVSNSDASHSLSDNGAQSHGDSSEENDDEDIFVAENEYVQLRDDGEASGEEGRLDSTSKDLDDAFSLKEDSYASTSMATRIPIDIEQAIDDRLFSELEERQQRHSDDSKDGQVNHPADNGETRNIDPTTKDKQQQQQQQPIQVDISGGANKMSAEHVEQIKSIMAGIQLNENAIPPWARRVPESEWMPQRKNKS